MHTLAVVHFYVPLFLWKLFISHLHEDVRIKQIVIWAFNENALWMLSFSDVEIITYMIYGNIFVNFYNWYITSVGRSKLYKMTWLTDNNWLTHEWNILSYMLECCNSALDIEHHLYFSQVEDVSFYLWGDALLHSSRSEPGLHS